MKYIRVSTLIRAATKEFDDTFADDLPLLPLTAHRMHSAPRGSNGHPLALIESIEAMKLLHTTPQVFKSCWLVLMKNNNPNRLLKAANTEFDDNVDYAAAVRGTSQAYYNLALSLCGWCPLRHIILAQPGT